MPMLQRNNNDAYVAYAYVADMHAGLYWNNRQAVNYLTIDMPYFICYDEWLFYY